MTAPALLPQDPGTFQISEPLIETDDDFAQAVVDVADEMDARRPWHERIRDAIAAARLGLVIVWHTNIRHRSAKEQS